MFALNYFIDKKLFLQKKNLPMKVTDKFKTIQFFSCIDLLKYELYLKKILLCRNFDSVISKKKKSWTFFYFDVLCAKYLIKINVLLNKYKLTPIG